MNTRERKNGCTLKLIRAGADSRIIFDGREILASYSDKGLDRRRWIRRQVDLVLEFEGVFVFDRGGVVMSEIACSDFLKYVFKCTIAGESKVDCDSPRLATFLR